MPLVYLLMFFGEGHDSEPGCITVFFLETLTSRIDPADVVILDIRCRDRTRRAASGTDLGNCVYAFFDACGGMSERTEQAALLRMTKAGATTVSVMTLAGEIAGDFRDVKAQQAIGIL